MAGLLKEFCDYIAEECDLSMGTTLHYGHTPATAPDNCSTVLDRVGGPADDYNPRTRQHAYQVYTRGATYQTAEAAARVIFEFLVKQKGIQLASWFIGSIAGIEPGYIGQDEKGRYGFSANYALTVRKED